MKNTRLSLFLLLFVAFLDYVGVGLIFPLISGLLFNGEVPLLAAETSPFARGLWMGVLIALTPLFQFLASPILGSLSDQRGRKKMILFGLTIGFIGYGLGVLGVMAGSLPLLLLYRCLLGISAATMTVAQAALVDMSTEETKPRYFALYNMAIGMGFALGPFLGGILSDGSYVSWFSYKTPFIVAGMATLLNLLLFKFKFSETRQISEKQPIELLSGFTEAKAAFKHPQLRFAFLGFFFFLFGWDYFSEFVSVTLIKCHGFSTGGVGNFYAYMGLWYGIANALVVGRIAGKISSRKLLVYSMPLAGLYLLFFIFIKNPFVFWFYLPGIVILLAMFYPSAATYVSDNASKEKQGEILGVYQSVSALAMILSPLCSGSLVGTFPAMPFLLGGTLMCLGGLIFSMKSFRERKLSQSLNKTL